MRVRVPPAARSRGPAPRTRTESKVPFGCRCRCPDVPERVRARREVTWPCVCPWARTCPRTGPRERAAPGRAADRRGAARHGPPPDRLPDAVRRSVLRQVAGSTRQRGCQGQAGKARVPGSATSDVHVHVELSADVTNRRGSSTRRAGFSGCAVTDHTDVVVQPAARGRGLRRRWWDDPVGPDPSGVGGDRPRRGRRVCDPSVLAPPPGQVRAWTGGRVATSDRCTVWPCVRRRRHGCIGRRDVRAGVSDVRRA